MNAISTAFPIFNDIDGQPLEAGYVWIGLPNLDPVTNQKQVYWDQALTQPATQPIRTRGGYPLNGTSIGQLYTTPNYSIKVTNKNGNVLYNEPLVSSEVISVKDFGAAGNGTTDDTAAIQAAIAAAGVGGTIFVPPGMNCLVSSEVTFSVAGQQLSARGAKFTKAASFTGSCVIRVSAINVLLDGLEIDGTDKAVDGVITTAGAASGFTACNLKITNCLYGISANSNSNVTVEGCNISFVASGAIRAHNVAATSALSRVRILQNRIDLSDLNPATTTQNALLVRGDATYPTTDAHVIGNTIIHAADPTNSAAVCCEMRFIDGGIFSDNFGKDGSMLVSVAGSNDVTVDGNVCDGATFYGIEIASVSAVPNKNIVVSDNAINGRERLNYGIGMQGAVAGCSGIAVTGNSIRGCVLYGIFSNENWSDIDITGNRIDITAASAGQRGVYIFGTATAVNHVVVTGNSLNGNSVGEKAVHLRSVLYATVTGNVCSNWTESGVLIDGSAVTCNEISVVGNSFRGLTANGIGVLGTIGDKITAYGNTGYRLSGTTNINTLNLNAALYEAWGTGTPEAAVTAGVGSIFHRTDGGASTCLYVKESGTGNTGWVAK